eukprot:CAMPEP_0176115886 /NCGR_PEP_ID=MMETSP0120_2-20121206/58198_1 /TAXON_ID=160619 /ORGANISM="Kryptoperidinium foliaceum, Strain CCMP 1326" /LENGTH=54 /DNA_ID=CAMNT_0017450129 /DNA_START=87 /DNA_END=248 /DNA_ORIENTATION=-
MAVGDSCATMRERSNRRSPALSWRGLATCTGSELPGARKGGTVVRTGAPLAADT